MKSLYKYLPVLVLAIAATSCDDLIDDKSAIDAKYAVALPAIEIKNLTVIDYATVEVSYTLTDTLGVASCGLQVATDAAFTNPSFLEFDKVKTEATSIVSGLSPETKYYGRLYFSTNDGTAFSSATEFETPYVPVTAALIAGKTYKGSATDYWGDGPYDFAITFEAVEGDEYAVKVNNLDPYFAANGFTADKGVNTFNGVIDPETGIITVEVGQAIGYKDCYVIAYDDADPDVAENYDDLYIQVVNFGASVQILNAWGITSSSGFFSLYYGGLTLKP